MTEHVIDRSATAGDGAGRSFWARAAGMIVRGRRRGSEGKRLHICLWHKFHKPPYGGGNQFMMALKKAMECQGVRVSCNRASRSVDVHICNSMWFDDRRLVATRDRNLKMIHRVDGPIAIYRGSFDWSEDKRVYALNTRLASATVYQSDWCFRKMLELGFEPVNPVVIRNAVDRSIFYREGRIPFSRDRKTRLISTGWSDNPKKGGPFFKSIENRIDWDRYEFTFVGRTKERFERIRHVPAQDSRGVAQQLRQHDIYVMASQTESCSNALIEALACGLPTLYLDDGGNAELSGAGGLPFRNEEEALHNLDRLVENHEAFQRSIDVEGIDSIARRYIELALSVLHKGPREENDAGPTK